MEKHLLTLRERQLEYLRILKELDRYCTENGLRYYLGCGTLIGAVRHKGFIPWDDDLDVFVPRPDYMRLAAEYHSDEFTLHTIDNDKSHPFTFGRLCSGNVFSLFRNQKMFNFGIDVYVIDGVPSDSQEQIKHVDEVFVHIKKKKKLLRLRQSMVNRGLWPFKNLNFNLMNRELKRAQKELSKYDYESSDYIWPYGGGRLIMKKENYGKPIRLQFEDGLFWAPQHYHDVLTMGYGDYMKLPPEEQRHPSHSGTAFYRE